MPDKEPPLPKDVAVTVHVPGPSMVSTASSNAHGPSEDMVTGLPEVDVGVSVTLVPCWKLPTEPEVQAGAPDGVTVMTSGDGAGWMLTIWDAFPLNCRSFEAY